MKNNKNKKIPVIFDTDIGTDIDDCWALGILLNSPEFDVKLITTATGNTTYRAKIVAKFLEIAKRTEIPIGIGITDKNDFQPQADWVSNYDLKKYPGAVLEDGVGAIIDTIMKSDKKITLIATGALKNIDSVLEREPKIITKSKFIGMHGSVRVGYLGKSTPDVEFNVASGIEACRRVFETEWDITITPLDTCGLVTLSGDRYKKILTSSNPTTQAIIENYKAWVKKSPIHKKLDADSESSILFDTVAIYLALSEELIRIENLGIKVTNKGKTVIDEESNILRVATSWKDLEGFKDFLVERLLLG
jgi:inosine-uridine nucleoside N-ribohydrolase